MDLDDFRLILRESGVDLWTFIDAAIALASLDCGSELKSRRDGIVERLYATACGKCQKIESEARRSDIWEAEEVNKPRDENLSEERARFDREMKEDSPETPRSIDGEEGDLDGRYGAEIDREQSRILAIKEQIEDPDQTEDSLINLLQNLADMDITFKVLKETDIGRHMTGLRKHTSSEVRRLAKQLIRKWKDIVDEWVKANTPSQVAAAALIADGDSPQQFQVKHHQNENQVADYSYSPNHHNGNSSIDRNKQKVEPKERPVPRREVETKQKQVAPAYTTNKSNEPKESAIDMERLASARKRLHENYKEAENAKKQRTIQVMDLQDIPKSKNSFIARNKGGFHGRHG